MNRSTPRSRPAWARCSSSSWAMPRPWWASCTRNATSASTGPPLLPSVVLSNRPMAIIFFATVNTNATRSWWSTRVKRSTSRSDSRGIGAKKRRYFDSAETWP